jgi:hypothetical protein
MCGEDTGFKTAYALFDETENKAKAKIRNEQRVFGDVMTQMMV